jgi:hypothetical protein
VSAHIPPISQTDLHQQIIHFILFCLAYPAYDLFHSNFNRERQAFDADRERSRLRGTRLSHMHSYSCTVTSMCITHYPYQQYMRPGFVNSPHVNPYTSSPLYFPFKVTSTQCRRTLHHSTFHFSNSVHGATHGHVLNTQCIREADHLSLS